MAVGENRELAIVVTAVLFIVLAAADFAAPQIFHWSEHDNHSNCAADCAAFAAIGVCIAQLTLIAAWAVFARGNIVVRIPWTLLFGLMMWYALRFGSWTSRGDEWDRRGTNENLVLGAILLIGVTTLQIPLWITKQAFRFRIVHRGETPMPIARERFQFDLQHLLIGTSIFAVALSPIRYVLPKEPIGNLWFDRELLLLVPIAVVADLVATLPCLWIGFRRHVFALLAGWFVYELVIAGIEHVIVHVFDHASWEGRIYAMLAALNLAQAAVVFAVARIYYVLGYRLQRILREAPPEPEFSI